MKYKIHVDYYYYNNAINVLKDGDLLENGETLTFRTVKEADCYLKDFLELEYDSFSTYSSGGIYVTNHGQFERPDFTIVCVKSGKSNREIRNQVKELNK